jgi:4-amino-4-deoxy-L-arabinose transferase-like glycosyltransferase
MVQEKEHKGALRGVLLICLLAVLLRAPYASVPFFNVDEALIAVMADTILEGGVIYRDVWEHQTPVAYCIYALVFFICGKNNMIAIHLFGILWIILSALMIGRLADEAFGRVKHLGLLAGLFYVIYISSFESWDVLAVNTEMLLVLPVTAAAVCLFRGEKTARGAFFACAGALCGLGAMTKQTAGLVLPAMLFHLMLTPAICKRNVPWNERIKRSLLVAGGFTLVIAGFAAYFWRHGALEDFFYLTVIHPYQYSSAMDPHYFKWRLKIKTLDIVLPHLLLWGMAGLSSCYILCKTIKNYVSGHTQPSDGWETQTECYLIVWLSAALAGIAPSGRFFGHYYIQAFPVLSLLAAYGVLRLPARVLKERFAAPVMKRLIWVVVLAGILIPVLQYQKEYVMRFIVHRDDPRVTHDMVEASFRPVADYVRTHTRPEDTVFVWGFCPQIYVLAHRKPASRFIFCNFLTGSMTESSLDSEPEAETADWITPGSWNMLEDDLGEMKPHLIVDASPSNYLNYAKYPIRKYPYLASLLDKDYQLAATISGMDIYRRSTSAAHRRHRTGQALSM